jgi:hypothetical protein
MFPYVGFEVLTEVSTKMAVFWDVAPCSLVEIYQRFRGHRSRAIALMMEAASTSETLVNFYQTTRRHIQEDSHLHVPIYMYVCIFIYWTKETEKQGVYLEKIKLCLQASCNYFVKLSWSCP